MGQAITAIFGANSTQFQKELAKIEAMSLASSRRVSSSLAGGGHMAGMGGITRETAVVGREIAMGRGFGRILASLTLLSQYVNTATRNANQGASAARLISDAWEQQAQKANVAALAALKKAEASAVAAKMEKAASAEFISTLTADKRAQNEAAKAAVESAKKVADAARQKADAAKKEFSESFKIAQAPGGLTIESKEKLLADRSAMKSASDSANSDAIRAEGALARAAAVEAETDAELQSAIASEGNATATQLAADADAEEAVAANAAAAALERKAAAAAVDAAAQEANAAATAAAATTRAMAMLSTLGIFLALVAVVALLYMAVRNVIYVFSVKSDAEKRAAEWTAAHTLAIWSEIEAMTKLQEASRKTTLALHQMNVAKDRSVELARIAVEASNSEFDARQKLNDAGVKSKLINVDIEQTYGKISKQEAIQKKADIEAAAVKEKAALELNKLKAAANMTTNAAREAEKEKTKAQKDAQAADDEINKSPEGKKKTKRLAEIEQSLSAAKSEAEQARKDRIEFNNGGANVFYSSSLKARLDHYDGAKDKGAALALTEKSTADAAASLEIQKASLMKFMEPDQIKAEETMKIAREKTEAANTLKIEAEKANREAQTFAKTSPAGTAAEVSNIQKRAGLEEFQESAHFKGFNLNAQQQAGSYAATPPEWKEQLRILLAISEHTAHLIAPNNSPPGTKPAQLGTHPAH